MDAHTWPHTYVASIDRASHWNQPNITIESYHEYILSQCTENNTYLCHTALELGCPSIRHHNVLSIYSCFANTVKMGSQSPERINARSVASCQESNAASMFQVTICATTRNRRKLIYVRSIPGPLLLPEQPGNEGDPVGRPIFSLSTCFLTSCGDAYPYSMFLWPLTGR